jgi:hypothetical protein
VTQLHHSIAYLIRITGDFPWIYIRSKLRLTANVFVFLRFKAIGTIEQKITVQAIQDEVFQATKDKVTSVVEEEKKNS